MGQVTHGRTVIVDLMVMRMRKKKMMDIIQREYIGLGQLPKAIIN